MISGKNKFGGCMQYFYSNNGISDDNVKGVLYNDEPMENHHLTPQFPLALQSIEASFSSFFNCFGSPLLLS